MVERTSNRFHEAQEANKTYGYYDKKPDCDFCGKDIKDTRVIKTGSDLVPKGVFCSYKCSLDWSKKNG